MRKSMQDIIKETEFYGAMNYAPLPVVIQRGDGIYLFDTEGKKYFDMLSAYSAVNQGHNNKTLIRAAIKQLKTLYLTSRAFHNDKMVEMLKKVSEISGFSNVIPMNTGAEAVETAIKAMRKWGYEKKKVPYGKAEIIAAAGNFHGRTTTIVGFSVDETTNGGFGPFTPGFKVIPYNDIKSLEESINENTVGYLVEPIQGEAGVIIPDDDYFGKVRELCTKNKVVLCFDEIQTGLGRTGKMFCFEHYNMRPDMLLLGKALSGGLYPVSVMATSKDIMEVFTPGSHGSTYGGNPLGSAIAVASLDFLVSHKLPENAAKLGEYTIKRFREELANKHVKEIRGKGLMVAVEFYEPIAKKMCKKLMEQGVLAKDTHKTTIRFAPPLIIKKKQLDQVIGIIVDVLGKEENY